MSFCEGSDSTDWSDRPEPTFEETNILYQLVRVSILPRSY